MPTRDWNREVQENLAEEARREASIFWNKTLAKRYIERGGDGNYFMFAPVLAIVALVPDAMRLIDRLRAGTLLEADAAARQARWFGNNCDAIAYFPLEGRSSRRGLLCVNHEYVLPAQAFPGLPKAGRERALQEARRIAESHVVPPLPPAVEAALLEICAGGVRQ